MSDRFAKLSVSFPYFVAPMVGLSHVGFRDLIRHYTPSTIKPLLFTEMLSTRRLPCESIKTSKELRVSDLDADAYIPQLLGNEEVYIAPSVAKLLDPGSATQPFGIDINMGCPVSHTLRHNWGFRLFGQPDYAAEVIKVTKRHSTVPVSVKLRGNVGSESEGSSAAEISKDCDALFAFAERLETAGADWLTIHPRPGRQKHKGTANWESVAATRKRVNIPVVVNGDIQTAADAHFVTHELGCDGAMFARAAVAKPWVLWQVAERLGIMEKPRGVTHRDASPVHGLDEGAEYFRAVLKLIEILSGHFTDERYILERVQFFAATGSKWYLFGHDFWRTTTKAKSVADLQDRVAEYALKSENPSVERVSFL